MTTLLFPPLLERHREVGTLVLRLVVAFVLVYGTADNVLSPARMVEFRDFLAARGTPFPLFSAHLSAYAQFLCGLLIALGLATRPAGLVMAVNFVCAYAIAHLGHPVEANWAPILMFTASIFVFIHGPGAVSVDEVLRRRYRWEPAARGTASLAPCTLVALLVLAACDSADPVSPPPSNALFAVAVLDEVAAPEIPPSSINQAVAVGLRLTNDYGEAVRVERSCGSVLADVQKEDAGTWRTVGTTGCGDEDAPLVVVDGDSTAATALFYVGSLNVNGLAGSYRLVLHVHEEGGALPDSMRTTDAFAVEEAVPFPTPEMFAPGLVSTDAEEYRITFTPDGSHAYFARSDAFFPFARQATIYETRREDGDWTPPVVASFSGTYPDIDPFVSPDGERLYFSSIRPVNGAARTDVDVWYVERTGDGWGAPQHAGAVNSPSDELYPSVAADGTLYVGSDRPGGLGGWDLYRAEPVAGGYGAAENLGAPVNTAAWQFNPVVSPDGRTLVYTGLSYPGGAGFGDLYTSTREGASWGAPEGIGAGVNTARDEFHASLSPDGRLLFFVRRNPNASPAHGDLHVVSWPLAP